MRIALDFKSIGIFQGRGGRLTAFNQSPGQRTASLLDKEARKAIIALKKGESAGCTSRAGIRGGIQYSNSKNTLERD